MMVIINGDSSNFQKIRKKICLANDFRAFDDRPVASNYIIIDEDAKFTTVHHLQLT
jgi:hypothetical protein